MADHSKPLSTSTYSNFVTELDARFDDLAVGLDPAVTTATNLPTNAIRWTSASNKWQKWNGSAWGNLSTVFDFGTLYVGSSGVGIGTSSPSYKLDVAGSGDVARIDTTSAGGAIFSRVNSVGNNSGHFAVSFKNSDSVVAGFQTINRTGATTSTGTGYELQTSAAGTGYLTYYTNSTERMRIDSAGNTGFGVTPSTWSSGVTALEIKGGANIMSTNSDLTLRANAYYNSANFYKANGYATVYSQTAGKHQWATAPNNVAGADASATFTTVMTLDASGLLGIGNTSMSSYLSSAYNLVVGSGSGDEGMTIASSGVGDIAFGDATSGTGRYSGLIRYDHANDSLSLWTSSIERMRIDSSGNVLNVSTGGLGYGTGSGGTVTQATSRTTGVTLNKTNGAITLVSAAGSTTIQSFTVTNSTVAATDTIIVNQKSGTDLYRIYVTAVAAGSFKISYATLSGTTTEQPVFNFAVIKAVTS